MRRAASIARVGALAVGLGVGAFTVATAPIGNAAPQDGESSAHESSATAAPEARSHDDSTAIVHMPATATTAPSDASRGSTKSAPLSEPVADSRPAVVLNGFDVTSSRTDDADANHPVVRYPVASQSISESVSNEIDITPTRSAPATSAPKPDDAEAGGSTIETPAMVDAPRGSTEIAVILSADPPEPVPAPATGMHPVVAETAGDVTADSPGSTTAVPAAAGAPQGAARTQAAPGVFDDAVGVVSSVPTATMAPLAGLLPADPTAPSPAWLAMLAWTRREVSLTGESLSADLLGAINVVGVLVDRIFNIYDLSQPQGWVELALDYTWGLPTTTLGNAVQVVNLFWPGASYRRDLSYHQGHVIYDVGFHIVGSNADNTATTLGTVISNAATGLPTIDRRVIPHEDIHIWQYRIFGPLMPISTVGWWAGAAVAATAICLLDPSRDLILTVQTLAYFDSPWEYWAYTATDDWPPPPDVAYPDLTW